MPNIITMSIGNVNYDIKDRIARHGVEYGGLFPEYPSENTGHYIRNTGSWVDNLDYPVYAHSNAIRVKSGMKIYIDATETVGYNQFLALGAFFKTPDILRSQTPYGVITWDSSNPNRLYEVTVPDGYEYVVFNRQANVAATLLVQPYYYIGSNFFTDHIFKKDELDLTYVENENGKDYYLSTDGAWHNQSHVPSSLAHSNPVYLPAGTVFTVDASKVEYMNPFLAVCAFFSSPENVIQQTPYSVKYVDEEDGAGTRERLYTYTVPKGYEYVVFNRQADNHGVLVRQPIVTVASSKYTGPSKKYIEFEFTEVSAGTSEIARTTGEIQVFAGAYSFRRTKAIPVFPGMTLYFDNSNARGYNGNIPVCVFYSSLEILNTTTYLGHVMYSKTGLYTLTAPNGAKAVVFNRNVAANGVIDYGYKEIYFYEDEYRKALASTSQVSTASIPRLSVPPLWRAVVGDTLQLFYRGMVEAPCIDIYNIEIICDIGKNLKRYYEVTPTSGNIGSHAVTINVRDMSDNVLVSASSNIIVEAVGSSPASAVNVLCVGDSLTAGGQWVDEAKRRLTGTGGSPSGNGLQRINFIGTVSGTNSNHEGHSGWTWNSFVTAERNVNTDMWVYVSSHDKTDDDIHSLWKDSNNAIWKLEEVHPTKIKFSRYNGHSSAIPTGSGVLTNYSLGVHTSQISYTGTASGSGNPFWDNSISGINFTKYCQNNGFSKIDYVYTLLTWNGLKSYQLPDGGDITTHVNNAKIFLRRLHIDYPNAKVAIMGIQMPSLNGGIGESYGATATYGNWYGFVRSAMSMNFAYKALCADPEFSSWVEFVHSSSQFDSDYNMPEITKAVNTRNSTATEKVGTNGVHPTNDGYMQIADAAYRQMVHYLTH